MKKIIVTLTLIVLLLIPNMLNASEKEINAYLFWGEGCPHCKQEKEWFEEYLKNNKDVQLHKFEIYNSIENAKNLNEIQKMLGDEGSGIPYLVIGNNSIVGFSKDYTPEEIKNTINYYKNVPYKDKVGIKLGIVEDDGSEDTGVKYTGDGNVNLPLFGKKDAKKISVLLSAAFIGLVDGFNPCAMWILIFLISMLLGMKNKKRMWALGITFLVSSAAVYFLFLLSWLNLSIFLNKILYIRVAISYIALVLGVVAIAKFFLKKDDGCEVVDKKKRKKIIHAIEKIIKEKSFILALLGIVVLASAVNIIELMCSLGLPVMFTQILAINDVSMPLQIVYSLIYVIFFLLDDLIVFIIAMKTLEIKAISNKFGKYSHLIGGIIMLIIGLLILYKPEWLMFNL